MFIIPALALPYCVWVCTYQAILKLVPRNVKLRAAVAESNRQCLLDDEKKFDYVWLTQRRQLLIQAVTYGQNRRLLRELAACSAQLNSVVEPLQRAGQPVILAPLHMVSDVLTTMVAQRRTLEKQR